MRGSCPCPLILSLIRPLFPSCLPLQNIFRVPYVSLANVRSVSVIEERVEAVGLRFPPLSVHIKASRVSKGIPSFCTPAKPATAPPGFIPEGIFRSGPLWIYHICEDLKISIDIPPNCPLSLLTASHYVGHLQFQIEVPAPTQSPLLLPWPDQLRWLQPAHRLTMSQAYGQRSWKRPDTPDRPDTVHVCFQ